jgi:FMN phosphatase YigB (HAD superfamily)
MSRFRVLFLDLDDTLYPSTSGLWDATGERIESPRPPTGCESSHLATGTWRSMGRR